MSKTKIGLIDVDGHNFPSLPLMKLSAWHKQNGDAVEWYDPIKALCDGEYDKVYMSKIFTSTNDYNNMIYAKEIIKGGTGYYYPDGGIPLPNEIEKIYPDYDLYGIKDTAYGFLTRGCPRDCDFCIVGKKEGLKSYKVADLSQFWEGQKEIKLLDPNLIACNKWKELLLQLIHSNAWVDFTQGLDIRLMTDEKTEMLKQIKIKQVHFAWDNYGDKDIIIPKLKNFKKTTGWDKRKMSVYVLTNYNSTHQEDLERIYTLRDLGYNPYIMIYEKEKVKPRAKVKKLQRWVNNRRIFDTVLKFEDYVDK